MAESVADQVIEIIAAQTEQEAESVLPTANLSDLGIDSLGVVEAIFAIEERFGVEVPFDANNPDTAEFDVSTVGGMIMAVETIIERQTS